MSCREYPVWRTGAQPQLSRFPAHAHICDPLHPSVAANSRHDHVTVSARGLHLTRVSQPSTMRRQRLDLAALLRRQPQQHILEIRVRIMPIHACRLDHAHDRRCPFTAAQRSSEEPVGTARLPWPDRIFDRVMVDGHRTIIQVRIHDVAQPPCRGKSTAT